MRKRRVKVGDVVMMVGKCTVGCDICPERWIGETGVVERDYEFGDRVRYTRTGKTVGVLMKLLHILGDVR